NARQDLRRPLTDADTLAAPARNAAYTRTAANEIQRQFHRLPNPDLVMYLFPHLAGTDPVPVPGYSTVFPLHQRVQYAMPGELLEESNNAELGSSALRWTTNLPTLTGYQWISLDATGPMILKKPDRDNDLQRSMAPLGTPWNVE